MHSEIAAVADNLIENVPVDTISINRIAEITNDELYKACFKSCKTTTSQKEKQIEHDVVPTIQDFQRCKLISDANYITYEILSNQTDQEDRYLPYLERWQVYKELAEEEELNVAENKEWKSCDKSNPKKLWEQIDWKDMRSKQDENSLNPLQIHKYFKNIFQSPENRDNPTADDIEDDLRAYNMCIPLLDDDFNINELDIAIDEVGTRKGLDDFHPEITKLFPHKMKLFLISIMNVIFTINQPESWKRQLRLPFTKKGTLTSCAKIKRNLPFCYSSKPIRYNVEQPLKKWYHPNKEQAGFRPQQ